MVAVTEFRVVLCQTESLFEWMLFPCIDCTTKKKLWRDIEFFANFGNAVVQCGLLHGSLGQRYVHGELPFGVNHFVSEATFEGKLTVGHGFFLIQLI